LVGWLAGCGSLELELELEALEQWIAGLGNQRFRCRIVGGSMCQRIPEFRSTELPSGMLRDRVTVEVQPPRVDDSVGYLLCGEDEDGGGRVGTTTKRTGTRDDEERTREDNRWDPMDQDG